MSVTTSFGSGASSDAVNEASGARVPTVTVRVVVTDAPSTSVARRPIVYVPGAGTVGVTVRAVASS